MRRGLVYSLTAVGCTAAMLGVATPAMAAPGGVLRAYTANTTFMAYTVGTGEIRAWQYCESSNGQTNWYSYGPWVGINTWSQTGTCTVIRSRGYDIR
ncbi:hypothetical protein [Micromonospora sp. CPCC 205558]|uniref:hypothetical protein n=1 Tax=Micromonospora sp. CPCC 205558 TaxID=3122403 RepID=UPI002FF42E9F